MIGTRLDTKQMKPSNLPADSLSGKLLKKGVIQGAFCNNSRLPLSLKVHSAVVVCCRLMEEIPNKQPGKKKMYESPRLVRYGDLVEVTRSFSNMGTTDNAIVGQNHKTG